MFLILRMLLLMQQQSVIRYFIVCQKSNQQIAAKLEKGYGQDALCLRAVQKSRLGLAPSRRMSKTIRDPEGLLKRTFAMLLNVSWKQKVRILHLEISARPSSLSKQQFSDY
jgi:hypothetical protein